MQQTQIIEDSLDVTNRLDLFGVTKSELSQVVLKVVMARNNVVSSDPITAPGLFAYIYGTRALRELFMRKSDDWEIDRSENIEATYNKVSGIKIIYQSADCASNKYRVPKAISDKGAGSERIVANGQLDMYDDQNEKPIHINPKVWYLYVSVNNSDVCAELSCPGLIENGQFKNFVERIFIIKSGEWDSINIVPDNTNIDAEEFEINVSRK